MLSLMDNIKYKKKHIDLFPITLDERKIFETVRKDKETLIGILFEHIFYYQIKWLQSQVNPRINTPRIFKLTFTFKDTVNGVKFNHHSRFDNSQQLIAFSQFYNDVTRSILSEQDIVNKH